MRSRKLILIGTVFCIFSSFSFGQNIGIRIGLPQHADFTNQSGSLRLTNQVTNKWAISLNYHKELKNNFFIGMDFSILQARYNTYFPTIMSEGRSSGGPQLTSLQFGPVLRKEFYLTENFGIQASLGILGNYLAASEAIYTNDRSLQILHVSDLDENGNPIKRPKYDIEFTGRDQINQRLNLLIRPELGLFVKTGSRSRVSLDAMYGINTLTPVLVRDLSEIKFEGQSFNSSNEWSGNHWVVLLGFQYMLKQ